VFQAKKPHKALSSENPLYIIQGGITDFICLCFLRQELLAHFEEGRWECFSWLPAAGFSQLLQDFPESALNLN
jgi:hypothetical protein